MWAFRHNVTSQKTYVVIYYIFILIEFFKAVIYFLKIWVASSCKFLLQFSHILQRLPAFMPNVWASHNVLKPPSLLKNRDHDITEKFAKKKRQTQKYSEAVSFC